MSIFWGIVTAYIIVGVALVVMCNLITLKIARGDGNPFTLMRCSQEILDEGAQHGLSGGAFVAVVVISILYNIITWPILAWRLTKDPNFLKKNLDLVRGFDLEDGEDEP